MFDVGFWELCLLGLITLLVVGPERLPKLARVTGFWLGKTRHMVASVKEEIKDELQAEEVRQILKKQSAVEEVNHLLDDAEKTRDTLANSMQQLSEKAAEKQQNSSNDHQ